MTSEPIRDVQPKQIAIIGAGLSGLSAAYDLLEAGHEVTIFEASKTAGGLAGGFRDDTWDWSLEYFYHHIFETDDALIELVDELGIKDRLIFKRPLTSVYFQNEILPFDSIPAFFKYPAFNVIDTIRFGAVTALLRYTRMWDRLEKIEAEKWMRRWYGDKVYEVSWKPALINKFGRYYDKVPMSWMAARLIARSFKLGYFDGGFQTFANRLKEAVCERGGNVLLSHPVDQIVPGTPSAEANEPRWRVISAQQEGQGQTFDQVLSTVSPSLSLQLIPDLSNDAPGYSAQLQALKHIGAVVLVVALKQQFLKDTYWLNLPATDPQKEENEIPFLALVEHTNFMDRRHYNGDTLLYIGDYVDLDHDYLQLDKEGLEERFYPHLSKFNPDFDRSWIRKSWMFRTSYAQPVPFINHSQRIPSLKSPLPGIYLASMSQVYPWDRGTNFAVELGRRVATEMIAE